MSSTSVYFSAAVLGQPCSSGIDSTYTPAITAIIIHLPQPTVLRFILQLDYSNGIVLSCPDSGCSNR